MTTITEKQYESLKLTVYGLLMSNPEMGLGDTGNCMEGATSAVDEWMKKEEITIWC